MPRGGTASGRNVALPLAAVGTTAVIGAGYRLLFAPSVRAGGPYRAESAERLVALTFDDGPNEPHTSKLVDLLGEKQVRATFFQVGECLKRYPGLSASMAEAGHVIGNHSYSHRFLRYLVEPSLDSEISRTQALVHAQIGRFPALFRPPWLCHQPPLRAAARRHQLHLVYGTFAHPLEVAQIAPWRIARQAVSRARPGAILIFHDGFDARGGFRGRTVDAARLALDELKDRGFSFTTVDRLLGVPAYQEIPA